MDGSHVRSVLDATAAVNAKYSEGANAFGGTPSIYINGTLLGNETYSATDFREAVLAAPPAKSTPVRQRRRTPMQRPRSRRLPPHRPKENPKL